jgi:hypothetical protein
MDRADVVTVKLHRALYAREAIAEAAAAFDGFATVAVEDDGDYHVLRIADINREVDGDVVAELCNFALAHSAGRHAGRNG